MHVDLRDVIGKLAHAFGVWQPGVSLVWESSLTPGATVCDIGANIGYFSLLSSQVVGSTGTVHCFEPNPDALVWLEANAQLARCPNLHIYRSAVGYYDHLVRIVPGPPGQLGSTRIEDATEPLPRSSASGPAVRCRPLTDLLAPAELQRVSAAKIDVEGSEIPILLWLSEHLEDLPLLQDVVVEIADRSDALVSRVLEAFYRLGYSGWWIRGSYSIAELVKPTLDFSLDSDSGTRSTNEIEDLLLTTRSFSEVKESIGKVLERSPWWSALESDRARRSYQPGRGQD